MIRVSQLSKKYGDRFAIKNLNFMIKAGEVVGFLGPNGAGKTTTMRIITGFMSASSGEVLIDGDDVFEKPLKTKSKIGYLPEHPPVYTDMTVFNYLKFVAQIKKVSSQEITSFVNQAIRKVHLGDVRHRLIQNLSKGYRQRVGLAGALVSQPKILILDEPTVGLDPNQVLEFRKLILSLKGEHTILLSTHVLSEVQATCDRIIIIDKGEILAEESLGEVSVNVTRELKYKIRVFRNKEELKSILDRTNGIKSVKIVTDELEVKFNSSVISVEELARIAVDSGSGLIGFNSAKNPVEILFSELTHKNEVRA